MSERKSLVLAAHGCRKNPSVNAKIRSLACQIGNRVPFGEVVAAFHQGEPGFSEAIQNVSSRHCVVVPLMTSEGYYANEVIPRAINLAKLKRNDLSIELTPPIGMLSNVPIVIANRINELVTRFALSPLATSALIVGHGTKRNPNSRNSTFRLVRQLGEQALKLKSIKAAFIDDEPQLDSVARQSNSQSLLVIPFLISDGPHSRVDIPKALGLSPVSNAFPVIQNLQDQQIVLDRAFGNSDEITSLVTDLAIAASPFHTFPATLGANR